VLDKNEGVAFIAIISQNVYKNISKTGAIKWE
jgi:hypothetical protein